MEPPMNNSGRDVPMGSTYDPGATFAGTVILSQAWAIPIGYHIGRYWTGDSTFSTKLAVGALAWAAISAVSGLVLERVAYALTNYWDRRHGYDGGDNICEDGDPVENGEDVEDQPRYRGRGAGIFNQRREVPNNVRQDQQAGYERGGPFARRRRVPDARRAWEAGFAAGGGDIDNVS
ncbi:MAG: hypothetical protein ABIA21_03120 [Candidatus Aenigmatarchaeota archaeon]